ncbi:MAG: MFS transporter [Thermodesulfobacteriota bacterium]
MTDSGKATWLAAGSHFLCHSYMSLLPALLVVVAGDNDLSFTTLGLVANVGYFLYGLGGIPAGLLADRIGSKRMLTLGVYGMSGAALLVGVAPGAMGFMASYALLGLAASIHHPAGLSLIARRVAVKGRALGLHGVLGNLGLFLAPLAASFLFWLSGTWRTAYIACGLLGLGFAFFLGRSRMAGEADLDWGTVASLPRQLVAGRASRTGQPAGELPLRPATAGISAALLLLLAGSVLSGFIFRGSLTFFPALFAREVHAIASQEQPVVAAGMLTTAVLSLGLVGAWLGGWVNDKLRYPELYPAVVFAIVTPALYLVGRASDSPLIAASALFSLVYYTWQPSQNYLIAKYTRHGSHGAGFGVSFFLLFGMGSLATTVGGYVADRHGVDRIYTLMAGIGLVAFVVAVLVWVARAAELRLPWRQGRSAQTVPGP